MTKKIIRLATRRSMLALWQSNYIRDQILEIYPDMKVEFVEFLSEGDINQSDYLANFGGKGMFSNTLETALIKGEADVAVHSMKDIPVQFPEELCFPVFTKRENPGEAFVSNNYKKLADLPNGAVVGTSSLRRQCLLKLHRPDLKVKPLRGNVNTRLKKLDQNDYDAIILAVAGLKRLGLESRITDYLPINDGFLPAIGQGIVGVQCRKDNEEIQAMLAPLDNFESRACITAERKFNQLLDGGCQLPIAAHAWLRDNRMILSAMIGLPTGKSVIQAEETGPIDNPVQIGETLASRFLDKGAADILNQAR